MSNLSFYNELQNWPHALEQIEAMTACDVERALSADSVSPFDFMALLSPAAIPYLEAIAQKSRELTLHHHGYSVQLFTPLYLSNYCTNHCLYCGFNTTNHIHRSKLGMEEVEQEGKSIAATGLRHILLLTGDAPKISSPQYIAQAAKVLRPYFASIAIEVYSMSVEDYRLLAESGIDSMTLFQETYNEKLYPTLHPAGPKKDFKFRLDSQHRAALAGMQTVSIGALLGLDEWRRDAFFTGLHGAWLQNQHPGTDLGISVPRMRPHVGSPTHIYPNSEQDLVQYILALRLFLPMAGITVSTRERGSLRDNLIPLGVTRLSAGVKTTVGGHAVQDDNNTSQFDIADERSVDEVAAAIRKAGYQPVFKHHEPLSGQYFVGKNQDCAQAN